MGETLPAGAENSLLKYQEVIYHYEERRAEAAKFANFRSKIEDINNGLDKETSRFISRTSGFSDRPNTMYIWDSSASRWQERCTITTSGESFTFIGDRLEEIDDKLVLLNTDLNCGIDIRHSALEIQSFEELERAQDNFQTLMDMVESIPFGGHKDFDCM